jgi:uncharacterized protein involved in type VI secretion and phage assembly
MTQSPQQRRDKKRFYGKYRGKVSNINDPLGLARICAKVPAVFGDKETGWALPSTPYAGDGVGMFFVPPVGANVWIEFEGGDADHPIWSGCFWDIGKTPTGLPLDPLFLSSNIKMIKTDSATITINDKSNAKIPMMEVKIEMSPNLTIVMDQTGIEISNGTSSVTLNELGVSINDTAFQAQPG